MNTSTPSSSPFIPPPREQRGHPDLSNRVILQYAEQIKLYKTRLDRKRRMCESILGADPQFKGAIITDKDAAHKTDDLRRADIKEDIEMGFAIAFFTDASYSHGFLGFGVVWEENGSREGKEIQLGRWVGKIPDGELEAIVFALGRAKKLVEEGERLELVRIYTDALTILNHIKIGKTPPLGPFWDPKMALEAIFERTQWLEEQGVRVELHWVKGHHNSQGNIDADDIATGATRSQIREYEAAGGAALDRPEYVTETDVPAPWKGLGQDWEDEWRMRRNTAFCDHWNAVMGKGYIESLVKQFE